jgi:electron transfer flavoprotein alpha/beta subunit
MLCGDRVQPDLPGEIGGRLAEEVGRPLISTARQIHYRNGEFWVTRGVSGPSTGNELREERLPLPAVIAVPEGANSPRMANAIKIMKASKASLNRWDAESLGIEGALAGESGSALRIRRTYLPGEE